MNTDLSKPQRSFSDSNSMIPVLINRAQLGTGGQGDRVGRSPKLDGNECLGWISRETELGRWVDVGVDRVTERLPATISVVSASRCSSSPVRTSNLARAHEVSGPQVRFFVKRRGEERDVWSISLRPDRLSARVMRPRPWWLERDTCILCRRGAFT